MFIDRVRINRAGLAASGSYVNDLPWLQYMEGNEIPFSTPVTIFVGENGSGKSTLLEGIAVAAGFNPEGGSRNFAFSTRESHSNLWEYLTLVRRGERPKDGYFLRAESFFNVATNIEELDRQPASSRKIIESYGGRSLHERSHGESFFSLVMERFGGHGLYILDEPEAALSPGRQLALVYRIEELVAEGSQLLISTHSPILSACPGAVLWELGERGMRTVRWEESENTLFLKRFLADPGYFLP